MDKEKVVQEMIESFNTDNRLMARQMGMSDEEVESNIQQSRQTLEFLLANALDRAKEKGLLE